MFIAYKPYPVDDGDLHGWTWVTHVENTETGEVKTYESGSEEGAFKFWLSHEHRSEGIAPITHGCN